MCCNSNLFIHTSDASASHLMKSSVSSLLRAAVAQRIERHTDYVAGNGFESRQWHAHQVAPQFVARGYFFEITLPNGKIWSNKPRFLTRVGCSYCHSNISWSV